MKIIQSFIAVVSMLILTPHSLLGSAAKASAEYPEEITVEQRASFAEFSKAIDQNNINFFDRKKKELAKIINKCDARQCTLLHLATSAQKIDVIKALKRHGAKPLINKMGYGPLQIAASLNNPSLLECLFEQFKDLNDHDKALALGMALERKNKKTVKRLLQAQAPITPDASQLFLEWNDEEMNGLLKQTNYSAKKALEFPAAHAQQMDTFIASNLEWKKDLTQAQIERMKAITREQELQKRRADIQKKLDEEKHKKALLAEKERIARDAAQKQLLQQSLQKAEELLHLNAEQLAQKLAAQRTADELALAEAVQALNQRENDANAAESAQRKEKQRARELRLEAQAQEEKERAEAAAAIAVVKRTVKAEQRKKKSGTLDFPKPKPQPRKKPTKPTTTKFQAQLLWQRKAAEERDAIEARLKAVKMGYPAAQNAKSTPD